MFSATARCGRGSASLVVRNVNDQKSLLFDLMVNHISIGFAMLIRHIRWLASPLLIPSGFSKDEKWNELNPEFCRFSSRTTKADLPRFFLLTSKFRKSFDRAFNLEYVPVMLAAWSRLETTERSRKRLSKVEHILRLVIHINSLERNRLTYIRLHSCRLSFKHYSTNKANYTSLSDATESP